MSFSKNPPWLATSTAAQAPPIGIPMVNYQPAGQAPVFSQPQAPPPPNISLITQMAAAASVQQSPQTLYTQTVSYPAPRPMNTIAYAQPHQLQQPIHQQLSPQMPNMAIPSPVSCPTVVQSNIMATQRAYQGTVTKIQGDVGFIDQEIFFHKSVVCKGSMPTVGESVFVEASYASNTPFKWNASRVQLLTSPNHANNHSQLNYNNHNNSSTSLSSSKGGVGGENGSGNYNNSRNNHSNPRSQQHRERSPRRSLDRDRDRSGSSKRGTSRGNSAEKRRPIRSDRDRRDRRDFSPPVSSGDRKDRSPNSRNNNSRTAIVRPSTSPPPAKKARRRIVPRYVVQIPKVSLTIRGGAADVWTLKERYNNLYIPSEFFHTSVKWTETFTPDRPFVLRQPCAFKLMAKDMELPPELNRDESLIDPPDADHSFAARVMLMSVPQMSEIYKQCFIAAEDEENDEESDNPRNLLHPSRMISFLVGQRSGKGEPMAIGGAWSPSLDGKNPESDPMVLIRTAIRTCKALTGIDLSRCTQWYRFVELYYHRRETDRVQTVVVFMPDIRACLPTGDEWLVLKGQYKRALERVLNHDQQRSPNSESKATASSNSKTAGDNSSSSKTSTGTESTKGDEDNKESKQETSEGKPENEEQTTTEQKEADSADVTTGQDGDKDPGQPIVAALEKADEEKPPTGDSELKMETDDPAATDDGKVEDIIDPQAMKMPELKEALTARNLPTKGLKADLVERLKEALKAAEQTPTEEPMVTESIAPTEDETSVQKEESNHSLEETQPDLSNMIVIDELCDPTKTTVPSSAAPVKVDEEEQKTKNKKESSVPSVKETRKLTEKDIGQLQRRYTLPDSPEIIVHPSKTAKGGAFDCCLLSLSVLLDYGLEDAKEHSFEVYLFAELFNEMLMRDAGFNIYKALHAMPVKKERETEKEKKKSTPVEEKEVAKGSSTTTGTATADDDEEKKKKERKKLVTVNPELLLSFAYFDQTQCGYILNKDLEDLFGCLGLALTKNQIRRVLKRGTAADSLYYRKLTDAEVVTTDQKKPTDDEKERETLAQLAKGNSVLLPVFKESANAKEGSYSSAEKKTGEQSSGFMYNGALVNVDRLMERIKVAEKSLLDTEQALIDVKRENAELSAANSKATSRITSLSTEVKSMKRKLGDTEYSEQNFQRKNTEYLSVLQSIQDKIAPILVRRLQEKEKRTTEKEKEKPAEVKQENKSGNSKAPITIPIPPTAVKAEDEVVKPK